MPLRNESESDTKQEDSTKVVEVPINLELLNQKLNYIIGLLEK